MRIIKDNTDIVDDYSYMSFKNALIFSSSELNPNIEDIIFKIDKTTTSILMTCSENKITINHNDPNLTRKGIMIFIRSKVYLVFTLDFAYELDMTKISLNNSKGEITSPLGIATKLNSTYLINEILNLGVDINRPYDDKLNTALHLAASIETSDCLDYLLKRGADPNISNIENETAIFNAARNSIKKHIECLIAHDASVNKRNKRLESVKYLYNKKYTNHMNRLNNKIAKDKEKIEELTKHITLLKNEITNLDKDTEYINQLIQDRKEMEEYEDGTYLKKKKI